MKAIILICVGLLAGLTGCATCGLGSKVTIPATDASPPTVIFEYQRPNDQLLTVTADTTIHITTPETIFLWARGDDSEGLRQIGIWIEETRNGGNPGLLGRPETSEDNNGSVGANACTAMLTQMNFNLGARKGNATTYRARIWAESVNFGGARTRSPILEILSP